MIRLDTIGADSLPTPELLTEYDASEAGAGDRREDALAVEIKRRDFDV